MTKTPLYSSLHDPDALICHLHVHAHVEMKDEEYAHFVTVLRERFATVMANANGGDVHAVVAEGIRLQSQVGEEIGENSMEKALVCAVAASAADTVFNTLSRMLDVPSSVLKHAMAAHTEGLTEAPVGIDGFMALVEAAKAACVNDQGEPGFERLRGG